MLKKRKSFFVVPKVTSVNNVYVEQAIAVEEGVEQTTNNVANTNYGDDGGMNLHERQLAQETPTSAGMVAAAIVYQTKEGVYPGLVCIIIY